MEKEVPNISKESDSNSGSSEDFEEIDLPKKLISILLDQFKFGKIVEDNNAKEEFFRLWNQIPENIFELFKNQKGFPLENFECEDTENSEFLSTKCESELNMSRNLTLVNIKPRSKSFEYTESKSLSPLRKIHNELQEQIIKSEKVKGITSKTKGIKKESEKENEKLQKILTRKIVKKTPSPIEILRKVYFENFTFEMVKSYIPTSFKAINGTQGILDLLSEMTEEFHKKVINTIHNEIQEAYSSLKERRETCYMGIDKVSLNYISVIEKITESYLNSEEIAKEVKQVFEYFFDFKSQELKNSRVLFSLMISVFLTFVN